MSRPNLHYLRFPRNSCSYKIAGTDTFRLSSVKMIEDEGTNLQNPNKEICKMYIPDEGRVFVQVDQSGAEALIVAWLCEPGKYRDLFLNNIKPHTYFGLFMPQHWEKEHPAIHELAQTKIEELVSHPAWPPLKKAIGDSDKNPPATRYYFMYKMNEHSGNYDVRGPTLRQSMLVKSDGKVVLSLKEAQELIENRKALYPEIPKWRAEIDVQVAKGHPPTLRNLFGFPRSFYNLKEGDNKQAYAFIPQSTVGTITNVAFTNFQRYIEEYSKSWDLLSNKHDSYLAQCPIGEEIEMSEVMQSFMQQELTSPRGEKFKMRSEAKIGYNWGET